MAAYGVQTTDDSATPNLEVYESLLGAQGSQPIARVGWSYADELDLRKLTAAREKGHWKKGKAAGWDDAWNSLPFLKSVKKGDLLFYRNLPAQGRFALVEVTGDYGYRKGKGDFRSYRPCKVLAESVKLSDPLVSGALRTYLKLPRRLYEINENLAKNFLHKLKSKGRRGKGNSNSKGSGNANPPESRGARGRGAAQLEQMKKRFSYVIGRGERNVNLFHLKYQMRLEEFLKSKGLAPSFEKDYIDVQFLLGSDHFIGEVKVTNWLSVDEAFRIALGQILDYAHTRRADKPGLIIFLDKNVDDERRLSLATTLGIAVVVERSKGDYEILNPKVSESLASLFASKRS